ncbi:excinuclease ABC subunit UvrB [Candidatus Gracilibacteria bacterium]|nr:excinuclease ABC subunit UvrB [Candidatus Gracilibacteria bacterium]MCF7898573.1 excinuclease ABC subunit UvrB [Candidatus Paceibacterota bacterium]
MSSNSKREEGKFILKGFIPAGDQPKAISHLVKGLEKGMKRQTLLGATGTGKTFTIANVIAQVQRPTLVIAHNKTLAAQLAQEFRTFFPDAAVHYFVSYYDYYQPEAYMPVTDTYIEKDAQINEEIDRLRHASTQALLTRKDTIIVASVSCIYGLGSPKDYERENIKLSVGDKTSKVELMKRFVGVQYERTTADLSPGTFRALGNRIDVMPISETVMLQIEIAGGNISHMQIVDPVSMKLLKVVDNYFIFPAKHFISDVPTRERAVKTIEVELKSRLKEFDDSGKILEAERIKRRTRYDVAMIKEVGFCQGIENYSRHLSGKEPGVAPDTLLEYFPHNKKGEPEFLTIIDESHVTLPQLHGMYAGDQSRKNTLVEYGFRLPSAKDNRPLRYEEFETRINDVIYVSATPSIYERTESEQVVEQIIRPTGLLDPKLEVRKVGASGKYKGQVHDFIEEVIKDVKSGGRVLVTTLTKKMAESLSEYLKEQGVKAEYVHSDIKTMDRIAILTSFRRGKFDCLVGVNLLREGLDLPEVTLIGIMDADKEGFLRSETSLIQTIGRAARNSRGRVILYADVMTGSMERAINETNRRRKIQEDYNKEHNITPTTIEKNIKDITEEMQSDHAKAVNAELAIDKKLFAKNPDKLIKLKEKAMKEAVKILDFETAAILRDELVVLKSKNTI